MTETMAVNKHNIAAIHFSEEQGAGCCTIGRIYHFTVADFQVFYRIQGAAANDTEFRHNRFLLIVSLA
jgi:hypothetical protein